MFCPSGHILDAVGKKLRLFSHYSCDRCHERVADRGGRYHKCSHRCPYRVCSSCYAKAEAAHYVLEPCVSGFPQGLGPLSSHKTALTSLSLQPFDVQCNAWVKPLLGGLWSMGSTFFKKTKGTHRLWNVLAENGLTISIPADVFDQQPTNGVTVQVSLAAPVNLPENIRRSIGVPDGPGMRIAWIYPLEVDWQLLLPALDPGALDTPEFSLLTIGGFIYFRESSNETGPQRIEKLSAMSVAFSARGALQFSTPQEWLPEWTHTLAQKGRWHPVTAQKFAAAGAKYMSWIRPEDPIVAPRGLHGGFVFLFREFDERETKGDALFFEVTASAGSGGPSSTVQSMAASLKAFPPRLMSSAFAFSLAGDAQNASPRRWGRTVSRYLKAARESRWALVGHLLGEWPQLAPEVDEDGKTVLHYCAEKGLVGRRAKDILTALYRGGASLEVEDKGGRTPWDLGDKTFRALSSQVWGHIPDLFQDPEVWFEFWDKSRNGFLEPEELVPALAAAYHTGELGKQWIETYVHAHYRELAHGALLNKERMLGDGGLLHQLQSSEEFIALRANEDLPTAQMPAIFREEGLGRKPVEFEKDMLAAFAAHMDELRRQHGWLPNTPAPRTAKLLEVPAPFAGGSADESARLQAAREMLAWSFTKTSTSSQWQEGFQVAFKGGGEAGIDEGGLTKTWAQEIAHALWADDMFFDTKSSFAFFKPDDTNDFLLHCFHVKAESLYRWTGKFLAYCAYFGLVLDCPLSPWALRWVLRAATRINSAPPELIAIAGDWQPPSGDVVSIAGESLFIKANETDRPLEVPITARDGHIHATLRGKELHAVVQKDKMHWSDGTVWKKCATKGSLYVAAPSWPNTANGDDTMLEDLATMDGPFANSLWRVHHEMPASDLQWLTFSYAGVELVPGGEDIEVNDSNKSQYVRLCCQAALLQGASSGLQAFAEGFFEVLPPSMLQGLPIDALRWQLLGEDQMTEEQLSLLETLVIPEGLVPKHLSDNPTLCETARWVFRIARNSDGKFRSRLLEFWTGSSRLPQGGVDAIAPRPRLQVMVQAARPSQGAIWEIQLQDGWYFYDSGTAEALTKAQDAGQSAVEFRVRDNRYVLNLQEMVQINLRTGARRAVRRRDPPDRDEEAAQERATGVRRIETWPATRLPEGHTCGNELWVPLCHSEEELSKLLHMAVMNFEAGFALA
mmetsp:Transcript_66584/g.144594  ORF Transcript_66584/g.144594 Transcript_66584/m.144594 type:complete len:1189 (-) Transcript_66584:42-3608(-)